MAALKIVSWNIGLRGLQQLCTSKETDTMPADVLANWAGYTVKLHIRDNRAGPDGFIAVDNIKYQG